MYFEEVAYVLIVVGLFPMREETCSMKRMRTGNRSVGVTASSVPTRDSGKTGSVKCGEMPHATFFLLILLTKLSRESCAAHCAPRDGGKKSVS